MWREGDGGGGYVGTPRPTSTQQTRLVLAAIGRPLEGAAVPRSSPFIVPHLRTIPAGRLVAQPFETRFELDDCSNYICWVALVRRLRRAGHQAMVGRVTPDN